MGATVDTHTNEGEALMTDRMTVADLKAHKRYFVYSGQKRPVGGWMHPGGFKVSGAKESEERVNHATPERWVTYEEAVKGAQEVGGYPGYTHSGEGPNAGAVGFFDVDFHPDNVPIPDALEHFEKWIKQEVAAIVQRMSGPPVKLKSLSGNGTHLLFQTLPAEKGDWEELIKSLGNKCAITPSGQKEKASIAVIEFWNQAGGGRGRVVNPCLLYTSPSPRDS